jgi:hypothetical protein
MVFGGDPHLFVAVAIGVGSDLFSELSDCMFGEGRVEDVGEAMAWEGVN